MGHHARYRTVASCVWSLVRPECLMEGSGSAWRGEGTGGGGDVSLSQRTGCNAH